MYPYTCLGTFTADALSFVAALLAAMAVTLIIVPWLVPKLKARGIVGRDLNKPNKPETAEMGGITVVVGFFAGVSVLVALDGIENEDVFNLSLSAALGAAFVGVMDDLFNLKQRHKAILPFLLALPLGTAVDPHIVIPYVADLEFGSWMILASAFAVTCAANAANMLEGFNGLGTGLGIIISITLIALCIEHDRTDATYLLVPLLGALIGFLWFNRYPAEVFPGDTMMLFMGATIAAAGIISNLQVQTAVLFIPMIAEFVLKLRGRFEAENYSTNLSGGYLTYDGKIESLTHIFMKKLRLSERGLVASIWILEAVVCAVVVVVDLAL